MNHFIKATQTLCFSLCAFILCAFMGCAFVMMASPLQAEEVAVILHQSVKHQSVKEGALISRIAFGSCSHQDQAQPIWKSILAAKPQLFLYAGDNIYGDSDDMDVLRKKWAKLKSLPGYTSLRKTCPVLATWDDHDYGRNDAGVEYPFKKQSQQVMLDFLDVSKDSPRRTREGMYHSKMIGPKGKQIQIILLDTRYFRSRLIPTTIVNRDPEGYVGHYKPTTDTKTTILGAAQWKWLEEQLQKPAELRVIVSSVQLISNDHGYEKWGNFPHERKRFFDLVEKTKANGVMIISGDRHSAEISRINSKVGYPIYDVTSSGLNRPHPVRNEINKYRVGIIYHPINFGMIEVDWSECDPEVTFQVRTATGKKMMQVRHRLSELKPKLKPKSKE